ncbi:MAG: SufS family cysteine desulfurase [Opitutaceae bacterium]|nr:SufS family cysteine desulfurase [Opitutaceae bacterium]
MTPHPRPLPDLTKRDWSSLRDDFPILNQQVKGHPLVYLDSGASSQHPVQVIEAMSRYYEHDHANVHRGTHALSERSTAAYEAARDRAADFFNAKRREEIVFTRGATEGFNLLARAWGDAHINAGDTILLTEMEHHSNLVPWQMLAERKKAKLAFIPVNGLEGKLDADALDRLLTPEVKLFAFTHVSNVFGCVNPVTDLCRRARAKGITTIVDAAQSAGHLPLDVQAIGCDFLVCSGHKMLGPTGSGVLYGRYAALEATPPFHGGGEMIETVRFDHSTYRLPPGRFEAGTPSIAEAIGLHAAMDYLDAVGRDRIHKHDAELVALARSGLGSLPGVRLLGPAAGGTGLVTFVIDGLPPYDLSTFLDGRGIAIRGGHHCTMPLHKKLGLSASARASFHLYNTHAEVECLVEAVEAAIKFFGV